MLAEPYMLTKPVIAEPIVIAEPVVAEPIVATKPVYNSYFGGRKFRSSRRRWELVMHFDNTRVVN